MNKKIRAQHAFDFVKQRLMKITLRECVEVNTEMLDTDEILMAKEGKKLRNKIAKMTDESIKLVDYQGDRVLKIAYIYDKMRKKQIKRRRKAFDMLKDYLDTIEAREIQDLKYRYCNGIDEYCLEGIFSDDFDEEREFGLKPEYERKGNEEPLQDKVNGESEKIERPTEQATDNSDTEEPEEITPEELDENEAPVVVGEQATLSAKERLINLSSQ